MEEEIKSESAAPKKSRKSKLPKGMAEVKYVKGSSRRGIVETVSVGYAVMMEKRGILEIINRN